jgi:hypothetical protein
MSYQLTNHDKWIRGRNRRQHLRDKTSDAWSSMGPPVAPAEPEDVVCCLTRGNWRRSLCCTLLLNILGTVGLFTSFFSAQSAGLDVVKGYFCLHDTAICPISDFQSIPTLDTKPVQKWCMDPSSTEEASTTTITTAAPSTTTKNNSTGGTPPSLCFSTSTSECIQANGLGQALTLIEGILHDGSMRLLNIPITQRWLYVGCGFLALHTLTLLVLELPRHRLSYSWTSRQVPERIFGETIVVICAQLFLRILIIAFLAITSITAFSFPLNANCDEINTLPKNDDIAATVSSRKQFLADCNLLHTKCHLNIHGISTTWTNDDYIKLTDYIIGCAIYVSILLGAGIWKWSVWSCCIADTVVDDDAVEMMDVDESDRIKKEQFDEAIRRIQLKRKIQRERKLYGECKDNIQNIEGRRGLHGEGIDEDGIWDGELRNENDIIENDLDSPSTSLASNTYTPTINSNRPRSYSPTTSSPTDTHVTLIHTNSKSELRPPTPGLFASHSYIISTNSNGQPTAQSVTQRVDERTGRIVTPTKKNRDRARRRNSPAKGSPQTPIEEDRVLEVLTTSKEDEMPANEDGVPICIVCLDLLNVDSSSPMEKREALQCGHVFHTECIQQWFREGGQGNLCPICRTKAF